jgi:hypothetical protein
VTQNLAIDPWDLLEALPVPLPDTVPGPLPGREGTLLAVVPVPGTDTALAIVGYAVPASGAPLPQVGPRPASQLSSVAAPQPGSGLVLDRLQRRVWADGREITLTFQEFELLAFFTANLGQVFSRAELLREVWDQRGDGRHGNSQLGDLERGDRQYGDRQYGDSQRGDLQGGRTVDVHVSRLRRKLGRPYGRCLITEFRVGYQFRPPAT